MAPKTPKRTNSPAVLEEREARFSKGQAGGGLPSGSAMYGGYVLTPERHQIDFAITQATFSLRDATDSKEISAAVHKAEVALSRALDFCEYSDYIITDTVLFSNAISLIGLIPIKYYDVFSGYREYFINRIAEINPLPEAPPRYWPKRQRGRPQPGSEEALFTFIRETYGRYFEHHRDELRAYIHRHDRKLYKAIDAFERGAGGRELPEDIQMPKQSELVDKRVQRAARQGLATLSKPERRSVLGRVRRTEKRQPKP